MAVRKPGVKPRPKITPERKPVVKPPPALLDEGDTVEYGLTTQFKHPRKGDYWIKMGATSTVRPGETEEEAMDRLVQFVVGGIDDQIAELKA